MLDRLIKRTGMEIRRKVRVTLEFTMSDDMADCIAHQAEQLLSTETNLGEKLELRDLVSAIDEALR